MNWIKYIKLDSLDRAPKKSCQVPNQTILSCSFQLVNNCFIPRKLIMFLVCSGVLLLVVGCLLVVLYVLHHQEYHHIRPSIVIGQIVISLVVSKNIVIKDLSWLELASWPSCSLWRSVWGCTRPRRGCRILTWTTWPTLTRWSIGWTQGLFPTAGDSSRMKNQVHWKRVSWSIINKDPNIPIIIINIFNYHMIIINDSNIINAYWNIIPKLSLNKELSLNICCIVLTYTLFVFLPLLQTYLIVLDIVNCVIDWLQTLCMILLFCCFHVGRGVWTLS